MPSTGPDAWSVARAADLLPGVVVLRLGDGTAFRARLGSLFRRAGLHSGLR